MAADPAATGKQPWTQRPKERPLWYARFLRYVALGPTRSVSLVSLGARNRYPVPAHWSAMSSQADWRNRASAFDAAVKADPSLIETFNNEIKRFAFEAASDPTVAQQLNGEVEKLAATIKSGGYQAPPDEEEWDDTPRAKAN